MDRNTYLKDIRESFAKMRHAASFSPKQRRQIARILAKNYSEDFGVDEWEARQTFDCI